MYESLGCVSCHGATGEGGRGPALLGVFGSQVTLNSGSKVSADEIYIRESILNPQGKIVSGFGPIMPAFQGQVNEEQLLQLVAYVKSLSTSKPEASPAKAPTATTKPSATLK
jgi:cytochrome c oxidase subunit 2